MKQLPLVLALLAGFASAQVQPTPYDMIRPVWPNTWDVSVYSGITDVRVGKPTATTPAAFVPNAFIPDTMDQAYLDALDMKMSPIRVNQAGYRPQDQKLIYYIGTATTFDVVDSAGTAVVGKGTFASAGATTSSSLGVIASNNAQNVNNGDTRYTVSASGPSGALMKGLLPDGLPTNQRLRVRVGTDLSATFVVSDNVYSMVRDATLKFFGVNRSGDSQSWFHSKSHTLDGSVGGTPGSLAGGWYDCGDHLKEGQTQAYAFMALAVIAATNPDRDMDHYAYNQGEITNTDGIPDMLREAKHGADFMLKAYRWSNGDISKMPIGVGDFGKDHGWWERPEYQDYTIADRGGPTSRTPRAEVWSTTGGELAAGLAILSKLYATYDKPFADSALMVAKLLYTYGKTNADGALGTGTSSAYNGNNENYDDLGLAAICLLWVTKDTSYLFDAVKNPALAGGQTKASFINTAAKGAGLFNGGWFTHKEASLFKNVKNTSWANAYTYTLYAFYKLILSSQATAALYGIDNTQRLTYIEDVLYTMGANLGDVSAGSSAVTLPAGAAMWKQYKAGFDPTWFSMHTDQTWIYNRYQAGNIFDVLTYADVAKDIEGTSLPQTGAQKWMSADMYALGVNQMNYMLGLNPWDMSMLYGVGNKNYVHPHHRGANPEGKNVPGAFYNYLPPVGSLFGGITPSATNVMNSAQTSWSDYQVSESCLDASATFLGPAVLLAKSEDLSRAPDVSVEIKYVGYDSAIVVVKQSVFGSSTIYYGTSSTGFTDSVTSTTDGVTHTFTLKPLAHGTTYYFTASSSNDRSGNFSIKYLVDSTQTPYTFTTLASPPAAASIQNVKVCNVSADSAEIMWYTPNGEYDSNISWDTVLTSYDKMQWKKSGDVSGVPTKFHYMKIGGLKEKTTYYFAVASNGAVRAVDTNSQPLKFTTPVTQHKFEVRLYKYDFGGLPFLNINVYNKEEQSYDSLTIRVYFRAADGIEKTLGIRMDICQAYNEAGFNGPCSASTITELTGLLRVTFPVKLTDTYDAASGTYQWYFPIPLGSTVIKSASRFRIDVGFDTRSPYPPYLDLMNQRPTFVPGSQVGDWTWDAHSRAAGAPADFVGILTEPKDYGDAALAPVDPYATVYRKDQFVWGYSPSYTEQSTKVAKYEITTTLSAPFNVSDGSYVQLDAASSTVNVKGTAKITENGQITSIWVNGVQVPDLTGVATYNSTTDMWDLNIPVKLGIGANKVDVTIFAGPNVGCAACQANGGCAFVNHNFFIQFSKGNSTASSLTISDAANGTPVSSPATPGQLSFNIQVTDLDKAKSKPATLDVQVINSNKKDTLVVKVALTGDHYATTTPIAAVSKDPASRGANAISFFGGDTILVRYTDPDDSEDVSQQTFFAKPTYPTPVLANVRDGNCDGIPDSIDLTFSQAFNVGDRMDSLWVTLKDAETSAADSFMVSVTDPVAGKSKLTVALPSRTSIPKTGSPAGTLIAFIQPQGATQSQQASVALSDGIAPVLVGVSELENPVPRSTQDTLKVSFSEPVALNSKSVWPLLVKNSAGAVTTTSLKVVGAATTTDNGKSWLYVVEGNTNGAILDSGFITTVDSNFSITDLALNALIPNSGCSTPVPIVVVPKPVPIKIAEMRDSDGDGSADELYMVFERKLRTKDMLDSFIVKWGSPEVTHSFLPDSPHQWKIKIDTSSHLEGVLDANGKPVLKPDSTAVTVRVIDSLSIVTLDFKDSTFPYGATQGYVNGMGGVIPRLGPEGGFFDHEYSVADKVGPVIMQARHSVLRSSTFDSLGIVVSERIDTGASNMFLERKRGGAISSFAPTRMLRAASDSLYTFLYTTDVMGAVQVGDSVRLVSSSTGVKDKVGNIAGVNNPWVFVRGAISSDVKYTVNMVQNVTGGNAKTLAAGYPSGTAPGDGVVFRLTVVDKSGHEVKLGEGAGTMGGTAGAVFDTTDYKHIGPTFQVTIQMPGATLTKNGISIWAYDIKIQMNVYDNLGQYVATSNYGFSLDKLGRQYLTSDGEITLKFEWMVHDNKAPMAANGKLVGSGPYIGAFNFNTIATAQVDDDAEKDANGKVIKAPSFRKGQKVKSSDTKRQTFGVMRAGK